MIGHAYIFSPFRRTRDTAQVLTLSSVFFKMLFTMQKANIFLIVGCAMKPEVVVGRFRTDDQGLDSSQ